jgi:TRAP-type uncharacterized transport system substrate-binding protein
MPRKPARMFVLLALCSLAQATGTSDATAQRTQGSRDLGRAGRAEVMRSDITPDRAGAQARAAPADVARTGALPSKFGRQPQSEAALTELMNANTVSVISGTPGGTYFRMASDMAFVLASDDLRILPILGQGAGQNAYDIRFLKGVDLGFVRTDTLDQLREDNRLKNIEQHIQYVAKLFNDELHVIAPREVMDIRQLEGKKVSFDVKGSGTDFTGRSMFQLLGLNVDAINVDQPSALDLLKKGEITAVVSVAAKPVAVVAGFDPGDQFHFVPVPYTDSIADKYVPAALTEAEYPRFVHGTESVKTLAVGTVLGVYNWPKGSERYTRIARFVDAFFSNIDQFQTGQRHPKWREVNLNSEVPGWSRFGPAQEWIKAHKPAELASNMEFERFLSERSPAADTDKDRLYDAFMKWRRERGL